jgi:DNA-directed RNA polymerase specialized sigma24 family protein
MARRDLDRLLARLSQTQRMTVLLREVDGMSVPEIAEIFGCPEATVWSRLRLAWTLLKGENR